MNNAKYADRIDVIKWSIIHKINKDQLPVLQIALNTTSNTGGNQNNKRYMPNRKIKIKIPYKIHTFFEERQNNISNGNKYKINDITMLEACFTIDVYDEPFAKDKRIDYFIKLKKHVKQRYYCPCVFFFDPDNSIKWNGVIDNKHINPFEISYVVSSMPNNSLCAVFEYKGRDENKFQDTKKKLSSLFASTEYEVLGQKQIAIHYWTVNNEG
jgi:hypothetical protein